MKISVKMPIEVNSFEPFFYVILTLDESFLRFIFIILFPFRRGGTRGDLTENSRGGCNSRICHQCHTTGITR